MKTSLEYPSLTYLKDLATIAGNITRTNFSLGMAREWKSDETPVTAADTQINSMVIESIDRSYPLVQVIGEEGSKIVADARYTVLCDPVDGTIPFSLGLPISTFCISVFEGRKPIMGLIYDPFQDRMWFAEKGQGAWLQTTGLRAQKVGRIKVSERSTVNRSNICMIWWKEAPYHLHDVCGLLMNAGGHWINPASLAICGGLIASGTMEGSIFPNDKAWETGAMQVIVEEAGGKVTDIYGNEMVYGPNWEIKGHIVSNGLIHDQLVEMVADCQYSLPYRK